MILSVYLLSAIWLGFIVAVPPGAVTVIGIQYALTGNFKKTLIFIAGSSLADCIYLVLVYAGFAAVMAADNRYKIILYFVSGSLFLYIGSSTMINMGRKKNKEAAKSADSDTAGDKRSGLSVFIKGIAVTLTNPTTVIGWLGVGGNFFLLWRNKWTGSTSYELLAIVCIMAGVELWFIPMLFFMYKTHKKITPGTHTLLMYLSSSIIVLMGMSALWFGFGELLQ